MTILDSLHVRHRRRREEVRRLREELKRTQEQLEVAIEALEYYADKKIWGHEDLLQWKISEVAQAALKQIGGE